MRTYILEHSVVVGKLKAIQRNLHRHKRHHMRRRDALSFVGDQKTDMAKIGSVPILQMLAVLLKKW